MLLIDGQAPGVDAQPRAVSLHDLDARQKIGLESAIDFRLPDLAQLEPAEIGDRLLGQMAQLFRRLRALAQRRHQAAGAVEQFGLDAGGGGAVRVVDLHGRFLHPAARRTRGDPGSAGILPQQ